MREKQKRGFARILAAGLVAVLMCSLGGCGSSSKYSMTEAAMDTASVESNGAGFVSEISADAAAPESNSQASTGEQYLSQRKLIKTVDMDVETKEFDKALTTFTEKVEELGGYIESMNTYNGSSYSGYRSTRNADMTIRIPKDSLETFLDTVSGVSNVINRSDNVEDVTLSYVDLESHRDALRTEQTRLLELLERAETIEDIITIESRLSEVRYQLESMESQLRTYDNKVDYSTVYLNINEVEIFTPVDEETTWERITKGFVNSVENIIDSFKEMGVAFLINLPYFLLLGIVVAVVILVIRLCTRKSRKERKAAQNVQVEQANQQTTQQMSDSKGE